MTVESTPIESSTPSSGSSDSLARRMPWPLLALSIGIPLGLLAITHLVRLKMIPGAVYPGVFRADLFYYLSNAREIFENGNGLFYGDPFSGSFDSPRVYTHLELLVLGWTWRLTDLPLAIIWQVAQVVFGVTMFIALYRLLSHYFAQKQLSYAFVMISLAGGGSVLQAFATSLVPGAESSYSAAYESLHTFGTSGASWLPNVFQNALFTTQTFYHTLAFLTFAMFVSGRPTAGSIGLFLVWWSHPFTGIEVSGIVGAFTLLEAMISRNKRDVLVAAIVLAISVFFLAYYLVLIPALSPEAADITGRWREAEAYFYFSEAFAMWGIFLIAPIFFLSARTRPLDLFQNPADRFLAIWLAVVGALLIHEIFLPTSIDPFQPLHFAHGYFFVPLAILTLRGFIAMTRSWKPSMTRAGAALLLAVSCTDNIAFSIDLAKATPPILAPDVVPIVDYMAEYEPPSFVIVEAKTGTLFQYLMVSTPHKMYLYNRWQTPFFEKKRNRVFECLEQEDSATACGKLGIRLIVAPGRLASAFKRDLEAGRARVVLKTKRFQVIELSWDSD